MQRSYFIYPVFLAIAFLLGAAWSLSPAPAPSLAERPPASLLEASEGKSDECVEVGRRLHELPGEIPARDEDLESFAATLKFADRHSCLTGARKGLLALRRNAEALCDGQLIRRSRAPYEERSRCFAAVMSYRRKALRHLIDLRRTPGEETTERLEWRLDVVASPGDLAETAHELLLRDPENEQARAILSEAGLTLHSSLDR